MAKKKKAAKKSGKKTARKGSKKPAKKAATKKTSKPAKKTSKKKTAPKKTAKKASPAKTAVKQAGAKIANVAKKAATAVMKAASTATTTATNAVAGHPLVGAALPDLALEDHNGQRVRLPEIASSKKAAVLYFYPKDDTPGCTVEACDFRDNFNRLSSMGVPVYGVSPDNRESHRKFREKHGLNFDLLVDEGHKLADALKVWTRKKFMGKEYMGVERSTFLVKDGKIVRAWQPVKVEGHVNEVLGAVETL